MQIHKEYFRTKECIIFFILNLLQFHYINCEKPQLQENGLTDDSYNVCFVHVGE